MVFMQGVKKVIRYIQDDITRIKQVKGYTDNCNKIKYMINMMNNKVYKSMLADVSIHGERLNSILPEWKEIETSCNQLYKNFFKYNDLRYIYNRWLYIICERYTKVIVNKYPNYQILESIYNCNHFIEYLESTMPQVCFISSGVKKFELTPLYNPLKKIEPRSIYKYDPNYKYNYNYDNSDTVYALLSKRS